MRTVKQVSDLTGISVRLLHYYDEIGLLKPSRVTDAGYRLYDHEDIKALQQILFFKELDIPLKEVKKIMSSPYFDKVEALKNQRKLLILKRKRLNALIELINKTLNGESTMSFKEFDMSEYFNVLEEFKTEHEDKIIKLYGSVDKYNEYIEQMKSKEGKIAKMAIKKYGSIEKYAKAIKKNFNSGILNLAERYDEFKKDLLEDNNPKLKELYKKLVCDLKKEPSSAEIQQIAGEITNTAKEDYEIFNMKNGDDHWFYMVQIFLVYPDWIKEVDKKYGSGSSKFIGKALKNYLGDKRPKLEILYEKLVFDLCKDPSSREIQQIVEEISDATKENNEFYKIDSGENHWGYMSELYLSDSNFIKIIDKKYGYGASKFMGEAFKIYAERLKE
ncbi:MULTISPECIES: MerR family transcriptional regulator [Clostridium]|uniref:HTH-type transcriptional activator tipA, putative n=1 Tax=Clostridium novyi (strain NT) TaxID=386415 RepID=A0PXF1_CLONN|nr:MULTISPECIES: MerR family transcriptional regulator [Clostridium]ABK61220.1 HTH-type transcriptional activator tipA, putative [Clostridium novyi NT]KEH85551.1 MerR family transcriptional regulator [Clostridium novyi A str. NCTC 538]KEH95159.1 MerR family transcriptional regulator [Clostridium botulinum C/D str. It1]